MSANRSSPSIRPLLVLWDIDHTLIDTGGVGRDAYTAAFRAATGVELAEHWCFDGRTELAAAIDALAEHGLPAETERIEQLCESIIAVHAAVADRFTLHGQVLPGIERLGGARRARLRPPVRPNRQSA